MFLLSAKAGMDIFENMSDENKFQKSIYFYYVSDEKINRNHSQQIKSKSIKDKFMTIALESLLNRNKKCLNFVNPSLRNLLCFPVVGAEF